MARRQRKRASTTATGCIGQQKHKQQNGGGERKRTANGGRSRKANGPNKKKQSASQKAVVVVAETASPVVDCIQEQLQKQRAKRLGLPNGPNVAVAAAPAAVAATLGGYVYDAERGSYFPESYVAQQQQSKKEQEKDDLVIRSSSGCRRMTMKYGTTTFRHSVNLFHAAQMCSRTAKRQRMVCSMRGRLLLESLTSIPLQTIRRFVMEEAQHAPTTTTAPWVRTFDVLPCNGTRRGSQSTALEFIRVEEDGGVTKLKFDGLQGHSVGTRMEDPSGQQQHVKVFSSSDFRVGMLEPSEHDTKFSFYRDQRTKFSYYPSMRANDFSHLRNENKFVLAGDNGTMCLLSVDALQDTIHMDVLPQSDCLCLETFNADTGNVAYFGHRNGQISLLDFRIGSCHSSTLPSADAAAAAAASFGSVVGLHPLFSQRPGQLLARGSNGYCRLFDLRKLGGAGGATSSHAKETSFSLVHELLLPTRARQTRCKGFATDPSQTCVIVPFIDQEDARFGVWSLDSGEFNGSKQIKTMGGDGIAAPVHDCLELSPRITKAWSFKNPAEAKLKPGSFGLWLNCGTNGVQHVVCV